MERRSREERNRYNVPVARETSFKLRISNKHIKQVSKRRALLSEQVDQMVLTKRDDCYKQYHFRLGQAKSAIDMSPPKIRCHVIFNAKRAQLERERQARISKDNFILLKKLNAIMHRKRIKDEYQRLRWTESKCIRIH